MKSHSGWVGDVLDLAVAESVGSQSGGGKSAFSVSLAITLLVLVERNC